MRESRNFASVKMMNRLMNVHFLACASFAIAVLFPASAAGIDIVNPVSKGFPADTSRVVDLDEVLVIKQPKESFRLRQQPLSSSMYSARDLSAMGARDLRELSAFVPSLTMPEYGSRYTSSMYVRGIGSRINSPAVGIYIDGVPIMSKSAFNQHYYIVDRVDVLRGPQSTLYGLNTEGGMVRLYTRNPFSYQGTDIQMGWGTRSWRNAELTHYSKLNDKFAFSLGGFYDGQNGFFRNQTTGDRADKFNEAGGRLRLMWRPTSLLSLEAFADYQYVDQNGFPYGRLNLATGEAEAPASTYQGSYRRNALVSGLTAGFKANRFDLHYTASFQWLKDYMMMDQDYLPADYMHLRQWQLQNAMTHELSLKSNRPVGNFWHWTLGSFFSAQWLRTEAPVFFDTDMTRMMHGMLKPMIEPMMYNAIFEAFKGRMIRQGIPPAAAGAAAAAAIERAGGVHVTGVEMGAPGIYRTPQFNLGFYHESNFDLARNLTATLGLRYDWTHARMEYEASAFMGVHASVLGKDAMRSLTSSIADVLKDDFNQLLPKFGLTYRFRDGNVYATVTKGYRSGGYNIQMFADILQNDLMGAVRGRRVDMSRFANGDISIEHTEANYQDIAKAVSYKPEVSWNYEVGTHLNLFRHVLQFDLSVFYMQVRNQQIAIMAPGFSYGRMMTNAGRSYSAGVETALHGAAFDNHLDWGLSYSFTRAKFKEYIDQQIVGGVSVALDYGGNHVPYVPWHQLAVLADYRFDIGTSWLRNIIVGANMKAQGKIYWNEANSYSQKFYAQLGAHADADLGLVKVSIWARNLTRTRYNTFAVSSSATRTLEYFAQQGNPFQMGVDLKFHF